MLDRSAIARRGNGARAGERWAVADAEERRGRPPWGDEGWCVQEAEFGGLRAFYTRRGGRDSRRVVWFAVGGARHATFPVISRSETFFAYFWLYAFSFRYGVVCVSRT